MPMASKEYVGIDSKYKYGINMKRFCKDHEAWVLSKEPSSDILARHLEVLSWLQHERLVHLIVTCLTCTAELFVLDLVLLHPETYPYSAIAMLLFAVLLAFYFYHYFVLENTVQRWYKISEQIWEALNKPRQNC